MPKKSKSVSKSGVVAAVTKLEAQLREDGYKGTQRAMRLLRALRSSLEDTGSYKWTEESPDFDSSLRSIG